MNEYGVKVAISPENIAALKEKYHLDDAGLEEVLGKVEIMAPMEARAQPTKLPREPDGEQLMKSLMRGDLTMPEVIMYLDLQDRRERRERREQREEDRLNNGNQIPTAEEIGSYVYAVLQKAGVTNKPIPEEKPEWAKEIEKSNAEILAHMKGEEEDKKLSNAIEKATSPLKTQLEKTQEKVAILSRPAPEGTGPPKSQLDEYLEYHKKLQESGIIQEKRSNIMLGPDGNPIPIKGEIPAALVYGPYLAEQIIGTIEKAALNIGRKYGLTGETSPGVPPKPKEPLIKMPSKPKPAAPIAEAPAEEVTTTEPVKPAEPLITMPEKPGEETVEEVAEELVKEIPEILGSQNRPCAQCGVNKELLPNGLCEECAKKLAATVPQSTGPETVVEIPGPSATQPLEVVVPEESLTIEKEPEAVIKEYICKHCGTGGFEKPWQVAAHTKTCPKAIEARRKEKEASEQTSSNSE